MQIRKASQIFQQSQVTILADTLSPYCHQVGLCVDLCFLPQYTSRQDMLQASRAAAWLQREGVNDRQFGATISKNCLASHKDLSIQVLGCVIVFPTPAHILKLERYRVDQHGLSAKRTRKFVKRSEFSTISSDHSCGPTFTILPVDRVSCISLFAGSSYFERRLAAGLSR